MPDASDVMEAEHDTAVVSAEDVPDEAELAAMVPQRCAVKDESSADWLVRKLVEAEAHIRRVKEQSDREIRRTEREWQFLVMRYGPDLERWARAELGKHKGRRKSLLLLSGTVGFRRLAEKLVVDDDAAVLAWARRHCRKAVVVTERVSKTLLNEHIGSTGELPGGTHVEPPCERFYVK